MALKYRTLSDKKDILFSIIVPTYNRANIIPISIESILAQTYTDWELIIVDDGSTDNTAEVVGRYGDKRIRYFYKENEERSIARNFGIDKAIGTYISFLDDDDYYLPNFLEEFNNSIEKEARPVGYFMCQEYSETDGVRELYPVPQKLLNNPIRLIWNIQPSIRPFAIHREIFLENKFDVKCKYGQDHDLIMRISLNYVFYYVPIPLSVNVQHKEQGTKIKFGDNYRENADLSIDCMANLIEKNTKLKEFIPNGELFHINNHIVYGYSSAAMKHLDFNFFTYLIKKIDFRGKKSYLSYFFLSLFVRLPVYYFKYLIRAVIK